MSTKIDKEQLKTMIASKVKDMDLNTVLDAAAIEKIKERIVNVYNSEKAKSEIPEKISEASFPANLGTTETGVFPANISLTAGTVVVDPNKVITASTLIGSIETTPSPYDGTQVPGQNIDLGTTGNIPVYKPELPSFMDKIEPAKVIIFSQNELSEGGENLSNKPLRTFENPDEKKSMNDFWLDKGQKTADVYMAKLEKIGELEFDYANGTTKFIEKRFDPDFEAQAKYKENPYMATGPAKPSTLDINGQSNIVNQIASSVDVEKVVTDIVMNILKNQLMTNTTKAVNDNDFNPKEHGFGAIKPTTPNSFGQMAESFDIKMLDLVNNYEKIDAPTELREAIEKNNKTLLVKENTEVQEWNINGQSYYTPVNKISTKKCYIKS